jgi:hypothetical protein
MVPTHGHVVEENVGVLGSPHAQQPLCRIKRELLALGRPPVDDEESGAGRKVELTTGADSGKGSRTGDRAGLEDGRRVLDALETRDIKWRAARTAEAVVRG